ncbi:MAG: hypothetical protein RIA08_04485 [Roseovarius sp.]|uniref:hypothetical protein n=1 Tax=Roseovarius sp. TaxID=1486281 RepID=UPI0032EDEA03
MIMTQNFSSRNCRLGPKSGTCARGTVQWFPAVSLKNPCAGIMFRILDAGRTNTVHLAESGAPNLCKDRHQMCLSAQMHLRKYMRNIGMGSFLEVRHCGSAGNNARTTLRMVQQNQAGSG